MPLDNEKLIQVRKVDPPKTSLPKDKEGHLHSFEEYLQLWNQSVQDPKTFFGDRARDWLIWDRPFDEVLYCPKDFSDSPAWFLNGRLNASVNCVDRHAFATPDKPAIIYEGDDPDGSYKITYAELLEQVCRMAQLLQSLGVKTGDVVTIYLPMIPDALVAMLGCARIGAVHSCVFAGFSPTALKDRVQDAESRVVITCDQAFRAKKVIDTKKIVDEAVEQCPTIEHVVVIERTGEGNWVEGRDISYAKAVPKFKSYCPAVPVSSEHPLFLLYTSGSTGKPKGMQHSTAGYLLGALLTAKHIFGLSEGDIMFTAGDVGWITGHTYAVYGPLANGATTVVFESTPVYPTPTRYWDIVDKHKVTQFYVAPTALRLLRKYGHEDIAKYDLKSLRVLGSVGEPIAEEVWEWYYKYIGRGRCSICDTYWLTESGSILATSLPGITPMKPGAAGFPFFGINPVIIDPVSGEEITKRPAEGVLAIKQPWPSMARNIYGDYQRFLDTYLKPYPGHFFTGDGAAIDHDKMLFVSGRIDDVVNVSGHRLSTAEIEACLLEGKLDNESMIVENAVVGIDDEITGQAIVAFVVLEAWLKDKIAKGEHTEADMSKIATQLVRKEIGPFAQPKKVFCVEDLPKTRSGKIMRRILRKIVQGQEDQLGELSTLSNPQIIDGLIENVKKHA